MTELQLYKFIKESGSEVEWRGEELVVWVDLLSVNELTDLIGDYLHDGGIYVNLQLNRIAFDIVPICEYNEIEPENILKKGNAEEIQHA